MIIKDWGLNVILLLLTAISSIGLVRAANPGHSWSEIGDGHFSVTGPTAVRTYSFPDQSTTMVCDNYSAAINKGGMNNSSAPNGGYSAADGSGGAYVLRSLNDIHIDVIAAGAGGLVGTTATQTLSNKTIEYSVNTTTDNGAMAGDLMKFNGSKFLRFGTSTPLSYVRVNDAGNDLEWSTTPDLTTPAGSDSELQYNSGGTALGASSSLARSGADLALTGALVLASSSRPALPDTDHVAVSNMVSGGREMLIFRDGSNNQNLYGMLQPNIFDNYFCLMHATGGAVIAATGCLATITGSQAGILDADFGQRTDITFTSTAGSVVSSVNAFSRGISAGGQSGVFYYARAIFRDANYNNSSGVRLTFGLSDRTTADTICGSDNVTSQQLMAFSYSTALNANWRFATDDGSASTPTYVDSGLAFDTTGSNYEFYIYAPPFPNTSTIYWAIKDVYLTNQPLYSGQSTATLPATNTLLNIHMCFDSVSNVTRHVSLVTMYGEVPK